MSIILSANYRAHEKEVYTCTVKVAILAEQVVRLDYNLQTNRTFLTENFSPNHGCRLSAKSSG